MAERFPAAPLVGRRGAMLLSLAALGTVAFIALGLRPADLVPGGGGLAIAHDFFAAALAPAIDYEGSVPAGAQSFLGGVLESLHRTVIFAAAAMSLAVVVGLALGFLASSSWWAGDPAGGAAGSQKLRARAAASTLQVAIRLLIAGMRSVHELLWAVILLAALGLNTATAVLAIAIPYAGTLAKVFSEMLDEAAPEAGHALSASGATQLSVFLFGRLPRALPDMAAYAFYRFECAVRSSAVLGFFGFETLGYDLRAAFLNLHYGEVWTYLYALLALVLVLESWSASLRRRFVA